MDLSDLNVGDWVKYNNYGYTKFLGAIKRCNAENEIKIPLYVKINEFNFIHQIDFYEGIPITKEILKQNGFIENQENILKYNESIKAYFFDNKIENIIFNNGMDYLDIEINFIHELQHAIKLLKINKEIKLND